MSQWKGIRDLEIFSSILWHACESNRLSTKNKCRMVLRAGLNGNKADSMHWLLIGCWDVGVALESGGRWAWACRRGVKCIRWLEKSVIYQYISNEGNFPQRYSVITFLIKH